MIASLTGVLNECWPNRVVIVVGGVGYEVLIPASSANAFSQTGAEVTIMTHLQVREDAHVLYGFASEGERDLFRLLVGRVSGVGPKLALAVLSGMDVARFKVCVVEADVTSLAKIKGLGKKTAERIVVELKDKIGVAEAWQAAAGAQDERSRAISDAVLGLIALGYKQPDAVKAVQKAASESGEDPTGDVLIRAALKILA